MRPTLELVAGWGAVIAALAVTSYESQSALFHRDDAVAVVAIDTVTYADKRIVYTVGTDTATVNGQLRRLPDLTNAPTGARIRVLWKRPLYDSAMILTGDTFAMSPTDSATVTARATAWGVTDPYSITLAWHAPNPPAPSPVTNMLLTMVFDTLQADWTESADSYQVAGGLNSGPGEDYTDTTAAPPNKHQVTTFGDYWSCVRAFSGADISDQRCNSTVYADTPSAIDSFPNQPAGYTLIASRAFDAFQEDGWDNVGEGGNYQVPIVDSAAPISPINVGQARYPAGFTGGVATHNTWRSFSADSLYVAFAIKYSSNWQGHSSGVNKILFAAAADYGGGGDPVAIAAFGQDGGALNLQMRLQGPGNETSTSAGDNVGSNGASATLTRDVWYTIEMVLIANTGSNADGKLDVWIDDVKTHTYTDIRYFDEGADPSAHHFSVLKWNPTWGGTGDTVSSTMYHWIDHVRISAP